MSGSDPRHEAPYARRGATNGVRRHTSCQPGLFLFWSKNACPASLVAMAATISEAAARSPRAMRAMTTLIDTGAR